MTVRSITKVLTASAAGVTLLAVSIPTPASALAPENPFSADAQPTWQTNGVVWAMGSAQGKVFAGGSFTQVRAPGKAAGDASSLNRTNFVVLDAATGSPTSCAVNVTLGTSTASVRAITASPDGSTIYFGGSFSAVNGASRSNVAAIDASTCALLPFNPRANSFVYAIAATASKVYLGGTFSTLAGQTRARAGAVTSAGAILPWAPNAEDAILALGIDPNNGNVVLGGRMDLVNGQDSHDLAVVDGNTGTTNVKNYPAPYFPYSPGQGQRSGNSAIKAITTDATGFYIGAEGTGGGVFDGRAAFNWGTYTQRWRDNCLGATQALAVYQGVLFNANHSHNCETEGLYEDGARHYFNAERTDNKQHIPWHPNSNAGIGEGIGPRAMTVATAGTTRYLWYGGEFTSINGAAQQGLTRFPETKDTGAPSTPQTPNLTSTASGQVRVMMRTTQDNDDDALTYYLYRGTSTTPIATLTGTSQFYDHPQVVFTDVGLTPGSSQSYKVRVSDGTNLSAYSGTRSITVAGSSNGYANQVAADGASVYFRMEEASGTAAGNNGSSNLAGTYVNSSTRAGQPGGLAKYPGTSALFNGTNSFLRTDSRQKAPSTYSTELWFKTSTTAGGRLIGYGNRAMVNGVGSSSPNSTQYDRHIYMGPDGKLLFGTFGGGRATTLTSTAAYNNNAWHHVVATQSSAGMALYVDGKKIASNTVTTALAINGYWRVGGDGMSSTWPNKPTTGFFAGNIDEAAVYPTALSATQVANHYALATGTTTAPTTPTGSTSTLTLNPTADTMVKQASSTTNYGSATTLLVDSQDITGNTSSAAHSYLKFTVPTLASGKSITGARLSLNVTNATGNGPAIYRTSTTWDEATMKWSTGRPARSSTTAVGNYGSMSVTRVSTAVSGVTAAGTVSFELAPESSDGVIFSSSEATTTSTRPQLILTISG